MRRRAWLGAVLLLAACTAAPSPAAPQPARVDWRPATLPLPAGDPGRAAPRDAVHCGGAWYVVGAVIAPDGGIRPAVWRSPDAAAWAPVALEPLSFYGRQNLMYSVACREGRIAAVGAKSGGAHGNSRIATWYQRADGSLVEVTAQFSQYGGEDAVGVSHIAGGPGGYLIAGNRTSGAAVWVSADAAEFTLVEFAKSLAAPGTTAADAAATGAGWTVVGAILPTGRVGRDPAAWTSTDGRSWRPVAVPSAAEDEALLRVLPVADGLLAVGVRGEAFGAWRERAGTWEATGRFGTSRGRVAAGVSGIAAVGGRVLVATEAEAGRRLWAGDGALRQWRPASVPVEVPTGADSALTVVGGGGGVLLVADDGRSGGVWSAGTVN